MFQALYRKWRPKRFDDVVGQSHITETLKNQVAADRLSHAYLFIGTRGTGKTTCAKILAKAVNCEHPVNGNPCNECRICRGIDDGSIMDVVEMDAASNNGVDNVRQLRDEAIFSPATAKKRVYIIDEVHMLSTQAFNALLKILEEPPAHLMFILATTELNKVPATILSRCQRYSFKRLDTESIIGRLQYVAAQEALNLSPDAAALIAGLSEGGMRDALSLLDQCSGRDRIDVETVYSAIGLAGNREIAALLTHIAKHDTASAITLFAALWQDGKDPATLLGELSTLERDILMRTVAPKGGRELLSGGYDEALLDGFKKSFPAETLINHIGILQTALTDMRTGQAKTICELALITLCEPALSDTLPALRERIAALEQAVFNGNYVSAPPAGQVDITEPAMPFEQTPADEVPFDLPEKKTAAPSPTPAAAAVPSEKTETDSAVPPITPAGSDAAVADDLSLQVLQQAAAQMNMGMSVILADPTQISAVLNGDIFSLSAKTEFARTMLDKPSVMQIVARAASAVYGRSVQAKFFASGSTGASDTQTAADRLNDLTQFDIVTIR